MNVKVLKKVKIFSAYLVLIVLLFIINLPLLSTVSTSFKPKDEILSSLNLFPSRISLYHYKNVFQRTPFYRFIINSFVVAVTVTIFNITIAIFGGYALARYSKERKFLRVYSYLLLALQMFPWVLMLIPLFVIFRNYGLINTRLSVIVAYTSSNLAFSTWLLRGFFSGIPVELEEAALIDGCGQLESLVRIILPLASPGLASAAIFVFLNSWNEYLLASIFLKDEAVRTLPIGLQSFIQQFRIDWGSLMAASTITLIPALFFLVFMQKYIVSGLTIGAVKG